MKVSDAARIWQQAGVSVIPILDNKTKRPDRYWAEYQVAAPTLGQVDEWWGNGHSLNYGLALICGKVSGGLEMAELEAEATDGASLSLIRGWCRDLGIADVWDKLVGSTGFSEMSPSGGIHLLYRVSNAEVPGNTKIARRPATEQELAARPGDKIKVLAETRGEGGYVIVAPSPGSCHPSGESWVKIAGEYGVLPTITWDQRCALHEAIAMALDQMPEDPPPAIPPAVLPVGSPLKTGLSTAGVTPGDAFEQAIDWGDGLLLGGLGWQVESHRGGVRHWTRAGKDRRDGASATTNRSADRDRLYVFSTSTVFDAEIPYTKFGAYALIHHGGDHSRAAADLASRGFGDRRTPTVIEDYSFKVIDAEVVEPDVDWSAETFDDFGNGHRLAKRAMGLFHYVAEEKRFYTWTGVAWRPAKKGELEQSWARVTEEMGEQARKAGNDPLKKFTTRCRNEAAINAVQKRFRALPGVTKEACEFNPDRHLINVGNGILDLQDQVLRPHDKSRLMTRTLGASYNPEARCPEFERFMEQALPDPQMRAYTQRALGYSMLGDADQRSIFFIHGPSGTGKSTLMDTMREVFGEYGCTAPSGAFKSRKGDNGPTNDLHKLRGRRFVTTSETSESASFDEDLLKRLSGRDQTVSRELYQENVEWTPECALWLATNHPPKFSSDDDAVWKRLKLIPFTTVFLGPDEVRDMARSRLAPERDGILNWLLAGLADYLANGLQEPEQVSELAAEQRIQSDSVARFLDEKISDGYLVDGVYQKIRTGELHAMYQEWARTAGERAVAHRRFHNRLMSNYPNLSHVKIGGNNFWLGIGRVSGVSVMGTMQLPEA